MFYGGGFNDSFPSTMMTYYTEKARKKQVRKQRTVTNPKGMLSRVFAIFRHK